MHLVSVVEGQLAEDRDRLDALVACFPAGTVSGAPKVRAMQIINELEPTRRGIYAGAVGYLDFAGNLDFCIAIRTIVLEDGKASIQAGAGIVADSNPTAEYEETERQGARDGARAGTGAARGCYRPTWFSSSTTTIRSPTTWCSTSASSGRGSSCAETTRRQPVTRLRGARAVAHPDFAGSGPTRGGRRDARRDQDVRPAQCRCWASAWDIRRSGSAFGGEVVRAPVPMHGKTSTVEHDGAGVFAGITASFQASRYHSLVVAETDLARRLEVTARAEEDGLVMGLRHRAWPLHGVQFHPESILTHEGRRILRNFLEM